MASSPGLAHQQHHDQQQQQFQQQQQQHPQQQQQLQENALLSSSQPQQDGQQSVDPSLQPIAAFNASHTSPLESTQKNQWGKRPAEEEVLTEITSDTAAKRQHLAEAQALGGRVGRDETTDQNLSQIVGVNFPAKTDGDGHSAERQQPQQQQEQHQHRQRQSVESNPAVADEEDYESYEDDDSSHSAMALQAGVDQSFMLWDANRHLRLQSLPILDNLSSQILTTLGKGPYQETLNIVTQPESDQGQAYNTMKTLFDHTKKLYTQEAFLSADELRFQIEDQRATIRRVNLATFISSVFGSQEVGFFHLNEHFLETFVPHNGRLLKSQGALYLDLKTQAYISAMSTNERGKEEILSDLFPDDMGEILLNRRPGAKQLTPSEHDFVARLAQRKQHLMATPDSEVLSDKYVWQDFLKEVSWYIGKHYANIIARPVKRQKKPRSQSTPMSRPLSQVPQLPLQVRASPDVSQGVYPVSQQANSPTAVTPSGRVSRPGSQPPPAGKSTSASQLALDVELFGSDTSIAMSLGAPPQPAIPQTAPTQVLYERARMAATAKASPNARRAGLPSQRRPWTSEEENALMAGLDCVKGPHWSQILAMFGPGGRINEVLKDRNQVQLKDKARNLKLFFLKSNIEVPYYLQFVTGELKTRAPGQVIKNAVKQAVEASAGDAAAHVAAVTVLGQALSDSIAKGHTGTPGNHMDPHQHQSGVAPMADMGMGAVACQHEFKHPSPVHNGVRTCVPTCVPNGVRNDVQSGAHNGVHSEAEQRVDLSLMQTAPVANASPANSVEHTN